ncbi:hypothetical protein LOS15_05980 [Halomonas sp. 7T]|uniref:hypothetical protein n=1 Tax=Halomonas sp. 7T TaxID=2893469 RepID=UPI0021DA7C80|nr:hypothetical protein [Halomonas sp. 7T]UXZ55571.1 hypothetical protein LOS15_05980 [Halomonas sp. 7T]
MPNSTSSQRIVPDVDQSLTAQHLRYRKGPRLWPLWLVMTAIVMALGAAAVGLWYERERLLNDLHRVSGEVSNIHARLDSDDTDAQDAITFVQAQMATLFQEQEQLAMAVTNTRQELYGLLTANEELVSNDAVSSLSQSLEQLREQASLRDGQLAAIRSSLEALEQSGTSGRQNLLEEVSHLEQDTAQRLAVLERQLAAESDELETEFTRWREAVDQRLSTLSSTVETLNTTESSAASQASLDALEQQWAQKINTLESDIRQVRQAQLAFSAQMEMLR